MTRIKSRWIWVALLIGSALFFTQDPQCLGTSGPAFCTE